MPQIEVFVDSDALANNAATVFQNLVNASLTTSNRFTVALSGGSTPKKLYKKLVNTNVDWNRIHIFWVDERCVPPHHVDSNYRMAADAFIERIQMPAGNIHRIKGELQSDEAASAYGNELRTFFLDRLPVFDLILLGLGTDGHTASLFPGSTVLEETERWVVAVEHETPPPPLMDRVTLTFPVLNAGKKIIFLVSGMEKAGIVARATGELMNPERIPVHEIISNNRNILWLIDRDSARDLPALNPGIPSSRK